MSNDNNIGAVLMRLQATIASRKDAPEHASYTASLLAGGAQKCAKKFGEEAIEAALAAASGDKVHLTAEAADVLYHLLVMLAQAGVELDDVAKALAAREGASGHAEKASRK
ncbi:phosphoribosyl-ATP diphosphatase [Hyphococcus sp.]|uniref:phosphoribosyl-ATP diphosphatase n=1 Tax=Hyphococcus sp. TaxID=2038636 RepID=UPI0020889A90|nr:MAG: phosphoribosyl-ATP pyrophosphatase [Marinicaulis sp.]